MLTVTTEVVDMFMSSCTCVGRACARADFDGWGMGTRRPLGELGQPPTALPARLGADPRTGEDDEI